jgi:hypothetical protein
LWKNFILTPLRRIGVIQQHSGQEHLTFKGLQLACASIVKAQWAEVPEDCIETVLLEVVLKGLRTGYAAATGAQLDPARCEFVWDLPPSFGDGSRDIVSRAMVGAPLHAVGKSVVEMLEHPLLRLAREYYPGKKLEPECALDFFRARLSALGVQSENDCPASELDLADWVAAGLDYGARLKDEQPQLAKRILQECTGVEDTFEVLRRVVSEAGGTEPLRLVERLKKSQHNIFREQEPQFYGEEMARVVYFSDFAIWVPWASSAEIRRFKQ